MRKAIPLAMVTAIIFAIGCSDRRKGSQSAPPAEREVVGAAAEKIFRSMSFNSRIYSNADIVIQPRVNGYLLAKNYRKGMPVKKGQLLYSIDPSQLKLTVEANRASLASAEAMLTESRNNYQRAVPLASINAISKSALDQYLATYASAEAQVKSASAALENSIIELGYSDIYAPIDGIIGQTSATVGDLVGPGTEFSTLSTVSRIDTVSVHLSIPVATYLSIRGKDAIDRPSYDNADLLSDITLFVSDNTAYPYKGKYSHTEINADPQSGTITLVVNFPNPQHLLKVDQYALVTADVGISSNVVLVPQRSVSQTQGINSLWIVRPDSTLEYRRVTLGETVGQMWVIEDGVEPHETILVNGQMKARNGEKIVPRPYGAMQPTKQK